MRSIYLFYCKAQHIPNCLERIIWFILHKVVRTPDLTAASVEFWGIIYTVRLCYFIVLLLLFSESSAADYSLGRHSWCQWEKLHLVWYYLGIIPIEVSVLPAVLELPCYA